jgi:hypothetical protein
LAYVVKGHLCPKIEGISGMDDAIEGNVIDVHWVLSEDTGQLMYESFARVKSKPRQRISVAGSKGSNRLSADLMHRWTRIAEDRKARGIKDG